MYSFYQSNIDQIYFTEVCEAEDSSYFYKYYITLRDRVDGLVVLCNHHKIWYPHDNYDLMVFGFHFRYSFWHAISSPLDASSLCDTNWESWWFFNISNSISLFPSSMYFFSYITSFHQFYTMFLRITRKFFLFGSWYLYSRGIYLQYNIINFYAVESRC